MMGYSQVREGGEGGIQGGGIDCSNTEVGDRCTKNLVFSPSPLAHIHTPSSLIISVQFSLFSVYGLIIWFGGLDINAGRSSFDDMLKVGRDC